MPKLLLALLLFSTTAVAEPVDLKPYSVSINIMIAMTLLTLLPSVILAMTSFTRIIIVLSILRQALGMPQTPSNQILVALAMMLTFFIMGPILEQIYTTSITPVIENKISYVEATKLSLEPMKKFMLTQVRKTDLELFLSLKKGGSEEDLSILLPAFLTSELKTAFQIGFLIFIPFLIIDLVVASVLMSMGMMMLSPLMISLPFKILLFVLIDGWGLLLGSLANSFG